MICEIYIRPLKETDAKISYKWRNDAEVWKYTGSKPDREITLEIEREWIKKVLNRENEKRFAICIKETDEYIGNVQLTEINSYEAEFHIFIGEKKYWGKGFGTSATNLIVEHAFNVLKLQCIYLLVKKENVAAVRAYEKAGFKKIIEDDNGYLRLAKYSFDNDPQKTISVFMMAYNHGKFISQALDGILMQKTDFAVEIVVGEDNSTDDTRNILLSYAQKYPSRLKLTLHRYNIGAHRNQISVLNICTGKYVALCEGDDYWTDPNKLQKQVDFLKANPDFSICHHPVDYLYEDGNLQHGVGQNTKSITTFEDLALSNHINTLSCVFRNNLFKDFPEWFMTSPFGDYPMHLLNAQHGKIKRLNEVMAVYRVHSQGAYNSKTEEENLIRFIPLIKNCANTFYPRGWSEFNRQITNKIEHLLLLAFDNKEYNKYIKHYPKVIKHIRYFKVRVFIGLTVRLFLSVFPFLVPFYKKSK